MPPPNLDDEPTASSAAADADPVQEVDGDVSASRQGLAPRAEEPQNLSGVATTRGFPKVDPALFDIAARLPKVDPAVFDIAARLPKVDPAVFDIAARLPHFDPAIYEAFRFLQLPDEHWAQLGQARAQATLSHPEHFEDPPKDVSRFSSSLLRPAQIFEATEMVIENVNGLSKVVALLRRKNPELPVVWRGQQNADWGLHSSLYRLMLEERNVMLPDGSPVTEEQSFPTEADMVSAETALFEVMRSAWRLDDLSGLQALATLQHHGGPTRLLDVTRNPLVALWFAVEPNDRLPDCDARLFAIASQPALPDDTARPARLMENPLLTQAELPFWMNYGTDEARRASDWGTGTRRRIWIPPAYDDRIPAQNAAFLLEGLPLYSEDLRQQVASASESGIDWAWADMAAAASFYALPAKPTRKVRPLGHRLAPVFSFRVPASKKVQIWEELSTSWGLLPGTVYPDLAGLSQHLSASRSWLRK